MPDMANPELPLPDGLVLRPFRGVRYAVDDLASVTSPPYDLITPDDTTRLLAESPDNVVRVILPERSQRGYEQARDTLRHWLASGVLVPDALPALYVYEQSGLGFLQRGLIGDVALADPAQMIILPHEDVLPGLVEKSRARGWKACPAAKPSWRWRKRGASAATPIWRRCCNGRTARRRSASPCRAITAGASRRKRWMPGANCAEAGRAIPLAISTGSCRISVLVAGGRNENQTGTGNFTVDDRAGVGSTGKAGAESRPGASGREMAVSQHRRQDARHGGAFRGTG